MKCQETSDKCMYHTFVGSFYRHKDISAGEICTRSCQEVQSSGQTGAWSGSALCVVWSVANLI